MLIKDSLQAFSSSIVGLLSSRAVLKSVGVGDSSASPTAALLLTIFQESIGRIATILFAHRFGTALEPECKMYRLLADILNDTAFVLDCLSPLLPKPVRVAVLSGSSVLRALCGVAAGSAKASLSAHFARRGNLGELNAKDSSQETVISLLGMLVGSVVVTWVVSPFATWTAVIALLAVHLETNRRAVRAVRMRTLNRQRATLVFHHLRRGHVPSLEEIARQECIFEKDGVLRRQDHSIAGYCTIGASAGRLTKAFDRTQDPSKLAGAMLFDVVSVSGDASTILWQDRTSAETPSLFVVIGKDATKIDILLAWWQALFIACEPRSETTITIERLSRSREAAAELLHRFERDLQGQGWDLSSSAMETTASSRITIVKN